MEKRNNIVITIARQYCSGGKTVGKMLAKELGFNCYSREILRLASEDSGISEQLFGQADEKVKLGLLQKMANVTNVYAGKLISPESEDFVTDENLFNYQAKIIKQLAETENCVIIGRAADFVLKDYDNCLSIFVHGSKEFCLARAMEQNSMTEKEMQKFIEKTDKFRGDYYKYYTGGNWSDARNYDLCLDCSKLGFEGCVEAIKAHMKVRFKDYDMPYFNK